MPTPINDTEVRITMPISKELHGQLKARAALRGVGLWAYIEQILQEHVDSTQLQR